MDESQLIECEGFLFIGDQHITSRRPGRRLDRDYAERVLAKLDRCMEIANEHRLVPVLLGDLWHGAKEDNDALKTRVIRTLSRCWTKRFANVGNHDISGLRLADGDSLAVVAESGALQVLADGGPAAEFLIGGVRVGLGFTPYGRDVPHEVASLFPEAAGVVWCTHHDVAFDGAYPGALEPHEIAGCGLVVNGHMHLEKAPVQRGQTTWCNFGSLGRTAIDAIGHEPCAWSFRPHMGEDQLTRHPVAFQREVFDLTGRLVVEASPGEIVSDSETSAFVDLLKAEAEAGPAKTADGALLLEAIRARFEREKVAPEVRAAVLGLFRKAVGDGDPAGLAAA